MFAWIDAGDYFDIVKTKLRQHRPPAMSGGWQRFAWAPTTGRRPTQLDARTMLRDAMKSIGEIILRWRWHMGDDHITRSAGTTLLMGADTELFRRIRRATARSGLGLSPTTLRPRRGWRYVLKRRRRGIEYNTALVTTMACPSVPGRFAESAQQSARSWCANRRNLD